MFKNGVFKNRRIVVLASILIVSVSVVNTTAQLGKTEVVTLKVVALPYLSFAPFFIAQQEGYFAEQGLDVEFVKMESMSQTFPMLLQGQLDVTAGSVNIGLFNAIARNGNLKIVADKGYFASEGCTNTAFVARAELLANNGLTQSDHVQKLKLATAATRAPGYYAERFLNTFGLTLRDLTILEIPDANLADALRTGAIDIASAGEPWLSLLLKDPQILLWKKAEEIVPDFQLGVIVYGPTLLIEKPEIGQKFMNAYLKGVQQYHQGKTPRNLEILSQALGLSQESLQETCWTAIRENGVINTASVLDFQAWAKDKALLDQIVPPEGFWESRFVEQANQMLNISSK